MRKIALDADPGVADALTLAFALFDPDVEIVALTSVGGLVASQTSARNLQRLVAFLDPPRLPRIGVEDEIKSDAKNQKSDVYPKIKRGSSADSTLFFNDDGDYGDFASPIVERFSTRSAATILRDAVRSHPRETSILALGPLTNVARAFRRDPELPFLLDRLVVAGGGFAFPRRLNEPEFNICYDRQAARTVFEAPCAKTFVPIDAVVDLVFSFEDLNAFDSRGRLVGEFVSRSLLEILRASRRDLGTEVVYLQEFAAYLTLIDPSLFSTDEALSVDEICGDAPDVSLVSARSAPSRRRPDVEIVRQIDVDATRQKIVDGLRRIAEKSRPDFPR